MPIDTHFRRFTEIECNRAIRGGSGCRVHPQLEHGSKIVRHFLIPHPRRQTSSGTTVEAQQLWQGRRAPALIARTLSATAIVSKSRSPMVIEWSVSRNAAVSIMWPAPQEKVYQSCNLTYWRIPATYGRHRAILRTIIWPRALKFSNICGRLTCTGPASR